MSGESKKAFEVKWRIDNIMSWLLIRNDSVYSPQFFAETLASTRWKLRLSRNSHLAEKYISLALVRDVENDHPEPISVNYELSVSAGNGLTLKSISSTTKFAPKTASLELNVKEVKILKKKETYLPDGNLTICCKLWKAWFISKGGQCSLRSVIGKKRVTLNGTIDYFSRLIHKSAVTANFMSPSSEISFISFYVSIDRSICTLKFEKKEVECKNLNFYSFRLFFEDLNGQKKELVTNNKLASLLTSHESSSFLINYTSNYFQNFLKNDALAVYLEIEYYPGVQSENIEYYDESKYNTEYYVESNYKKLTDESAVLENVNTSNLEKEYSLSLVNFYLSEHKDITCHIEKEEFSDEDECSDGAVKMYLPFTTLKEDLESLYNDRLFCDTKLRTDTEIFSVHRNVLSARSPVFKKMFTADMKEKAGECVDVPDLSSDTIRRMLQFLYTDCIGELDMQTAKDLYIASDKYDIASLKQCCSSFMKRNLCPANVCEVIVLADMHQDKDLASAANDFVLIYDKEVFDSDEWKQFMKNFGNLSAEIMYLKCMES